MVLALKKKASESTSKQLEKAFSKDSISIKKKHAWAKFFGKLKLNQNPVKFQRQLRDE